MRRRAEARQARRRRPWRRVSNYCVRCIVLSPDCANEVFVLARTAHEPRWFVVSPASAPLAIHGARFELQDGETLIAGARAPAADLLKKDASCGITWPVVKP